MLSQAQDVKLCIKTKFRAPRRRRAEARQCDGLKFYDYLNFFTFPLMLTRLSCRYKSFNELTQHSTGSLELYSVAYIAFGLHAFAVLRLVLFFQENCVAFLNTRQKIYIQWKKGLATAARSGKNTQLFSSITLRKNYHHKLLIAFATIQQSKTLLEHNGYRSCTSLPNWFMTTQIWPYLFR